MVVQVVYLEQVQHWEVGSLLRFAEEDIEVRHCMAIVHLM